MATPNETDFAKKYFLNKKKKQKPMPIFFFFFSLYIVSLSVPFKVHFISSTKFLLVHFISSTKFLFQVFKICLTEFWLLIVLK